MLHAWPAQVAQNDKQDLVHIALLKSSSCHATGGALARVQHAWPAQVAQNQGSDDLRSLKPPTSTTAFILLS